MSSSRVGTVAVVAGLVAIGAAEPAEARPDGGEGDSSQAQASAKKTPPRSRARVEHGLVATLPGFEMLPDGGSRLFVALTHSASVTEKREPRTLTYVIHGAHVALRNNENALVTVHFNTPVTRARLLPLRGDLVFTVELRADTAATYRVVDAGDGSSLLQIDFPKGTFLPPGEWDSATVVDTNELADARARARRPGSVAPPAPPPAPPAQPAPAPPGPPSTPGS